MEEITKIFIIIAIVIFIIIVNIKFLKVSEWNDGECEKHKFAWKYIGRDGNSRELYICPKNCITLKEIKSEDIYTTSST